MKALLINSTERTVTTVDYADYRDIQRYVGGPFAGACVFDNGDALLVDDEGLYKDHEHYFFVNGMAQPLAGNGLLTGRDHYSRKTGEESTLDVTTTPADMLQLVRWATLEQVRAWGRANSSEVAASITSIHTDGTREEVLLGRWGDLLGVAPGNKGDRT